uniref:Uncharacterized protein n=1 Tax=Chelydra serpentina TaxID=8475 RepID=A0A8C3S2F2_CHESE
MGAPAPDRPRRQRLCPLGSPCQVPRGEHVPGDLPQAVRVGSRPPAPGSAPRGQVIVSVGRRARRGRAAGEDLDSPLGCFDPRTERWGAPLGSVPVRFPGFAALGHRLYVAGGCGPDGCFSTSLHEYDACSGQWAELPSMSWPLDPHGFLVCSRRLYAVGGCAEAAGKLDSAESFDLEQKQWAPTTRLPFPLSYFASATLHNKIYLIGGKKHVGGALATHRGLLIYHVSSDSWAQVPLAVGLWDPPGLTAIDTHQRVITGHLGQAHPSGATLGRVWSGGSPGDRTSSPELGWGCWFEDDLDCSLVPARPHRSAHEAAPAPVARRDALPRDVIQPFPRDSQAVFPAGCFSALQ